MCHSHTATVAIGVGDGGAGDICHPTPMVPPKKNNSEEDIFRANIMLNSELYTNKAESILPPVIL